MHKKKPVQIEAVKLIIWLAIMFLIAFASDVFITRALGQRPQHVDIDSAMSYIDLGLYVQAPTPYFVYEGDDFISFSLPYSTEILGIMYVYVYDCQKSGTEPTFVGFLDWFESHCKNCEIPKYNDTQNKTE